MNTAKLELAGRTALVTGSSRGIGRAIGLRLADAGANVLFHGSKMSENLASAVAEAGDKCRAVTGDLSTPEGVAELLAELPPVIDVLVLNASVQSYTSIESYNVPEFERQMMTNLSSSFQLIQHCAPAMRRQQWGRIIAVSSINQVRPAARLAIYSATKGALANLASGAAKLYAADRVTVNTILPGVIVTDRNREVLKNEEFANTLKQEIPAHRFGTAEECAELVGFLVSEAAGYITGAEIPIAGGWQL